METRTYAIIGAGMMGREHIANLALLPEAKLIALADPDAGSRKWSGKAAGEDVRVFSDYMEMMREAKPDAVIIASPNFSHIDVVTDIAKFGAAILVEKPLATTVKDARFLAQLAKSYPNLFWIGLEYRYMPPIAKFIDVLHHGLTGPVKMLSFREHRFPFLPKVGDWNRFSENTGGTLVEKCCHFFDLMRYALQSDPIRIYATGGMDVNHLTERYDGRTPDILDNAYVVLDFASGTRAMLELCMFANLTHQEERLHVVGTEGRLSVSIPEAIVDWSPLRGEPWSEKIETPKDVLAAGDHHGATYFQLRDFHDALVSGRGPTLSAQDGLWSVKIGAAAHRSIETGLPVSLDENGDFT
ncbi:inositol 2-dehydrogenase [Litorimonas cladophorae]|uniref:Inositol 2-dehydrogenase n=1 Tax=Litorimonas cladophorae TaxID=1220491 RepID=A0A918NAQ3_9PROT|nr:Gfo/Idh/MocA family oxidoreductase [Litorimonas cladophorae]GGX56800.1 inositol 2-dehydrogenase [Litorimonas cladophorae]